MENKEKIEKYLWEKSSIKSVRKLLKNIERRLNLYYDDETLLRKMNYEDLIEIINESEHIEQITRVCLSLLEGPELVQYDKEYSSDSNCTFVVSTEEEALKKIKEKPNYRIPPLQEKIRYFDEIFEFYTPLTFKRGFKKHNFRPNYHLAYQMEEAIKKWVNDNDFNLKTAIESPYILVMKRVVPEYANNRDLDADNFENQRIINKITGAFGLNDGAKNMWLFSALEENPNKKAGMYFYLISAKDIDKLKNLFPFVLINYDRNLSTFDKLFDKVKKVYKKLFDNYLNNKDV